MAFWFGPGQHHLQDIQVTHAQFSPAKAAQNAALLSPCLAARVFYVLSLQPAEPLASCSSRTLLRLSSFDIELRMIAYCSLLFWLQLICSKLFDTNVPSLSNHVLTCTRVSMQPAISATLKGAPLPALKAPKLILSALLCSDVIWYKTILGRREGTALCLRPFAAALSVVSQRPGIENEV